MAQKNPAGKNTAVKISLQGISLLVVVLIAMYSLKYAVVEQIAASRSDYLDLTAGLQTNPDILAELARRDYLTGDLKKARKLYLRAIDNFVLHVPSWLGLAEVSLDQGKREEAVAALKMLDSLQVDNLDPLWRKATLAKVLDQEKILLSTLKVLMEKDLAHRNRVFDIAGNYWQDPQTLISNFSAICYPDILNLYIRNNRPADVQTVWREYAKSGQVTPESTIAYTAFLMKNNAFDLAAEVWRKWSIYRNSLLYNGNFEEAIQNSPFCWQTSGTDGVSLHYGDFGGGLSIAFDGTENAAFMLSQVVPLYPGEHVFRGSFETTGLTSQERPYWLISGYNCKGLYIKDDMLPPSAYRTGFAIPFTVPNRCKAVKIDLIRNRANPYDSLISGNVTLKNLSITRESPIPEGNMPQRKSLVNPAGSTPINLRPGPEGITKVAGVTEQVTGSTSNPNSLKNKIVGPNLSPGKTRIFINKLIVRP